MILRYRLVAFLFRYWWSLPVVVTLPGTITLSVITRRLFTPQTWMRKTNLVVHLSCFPLTPITYSPPFDSEWPGLLHSVNSHFRCVTYCRLFDYIRWVAYGYRASLWRIRVGIENEGRPLIWLRKDSFGCSAELFSCDPNYILSSVWFTVTWALAFLKITISSVILCLF